MQIAKACGAYVIGTASVGKHPLLNDLGVDEPVDYRAEAFERVVEPVDLVLDLIGGDVALRSLEVLRPDGRLICLPSAAAEAAVGAAAERGLRRPGLDEPTARWRAGLGGGEVRCWSPNVPADGRAAHRAGEIGHTTGKLVRTI